MQQKDIGKKTKIKLGIETLKYKIQLKLDLSKVLIYENSKMIKN